MAKYSKKTKLSLSEAEVLLNEFFGALSQISGKEEVSKVLADLFTKQELVMVARRLKIARLLLAGDTYQMAQKKTRAGMATVARVSAWLNTSGEGYRLLHARDKIKEGKPVSPTWQSLKKRYPLYFWPQLLSQEINHQISDKERSKIQKVLELLTEKGRVVKSVGAAPRTSFRRRI